MEDFREECGGYIPREPASEPPVVYPAGRREVVFLLLTAAAAFFFCNSLMYGGFRLGFAIGMVLCIFCGWGYLFACGRKPGLYSRFLLAASAVIAAGFARSGDGFVKFVMLGFLFVGVNLGLTLQAGAERHAPGTMGTLLDAFYTAFVHSCRLDRSFRGLRELFRKSGAAGRKGGAVATGLLIAVPLVALMIFLLMRADAAFEGLMDKLPQICFGEVLATVVWGGILACLLYTKGTSLFRGKKELREKKQRKGINPLTVNTVLLAVGIVYLVYLVSQLAYFAGGLSGILPEEYTMAEYARRGFFEMAWLCAINLGIVGLAVGLVEKEKGTPLATKLLCLFVSLITVFFVVAASGKMFLYIGSYGLTRLRVLTQVIMLWLCAATVLVAVWIFCPRLAYMKSVIAVAMIIGAVVIWADVDTVVAKYNVSAYLSGEMEQIDMAHMGTLNEAAVPYIRTLAAEAPDPEVRQMAEDLLANWYSGWYVDVVDDFRGWTYVSHIAEEILPREEVLDLP